jgi:3-oxoadipate enol-lactonase
LPTANVPGAQLHFELEGPATAPVVLFSNSLGTTHRMWDPQIAAFAKHFRVLRYDTRGHGNSSAPGGPYCVEQLAADALALLDTLHLDRVHFCGLSLGGMTGMFLGATLSSRFRKLVLSNTAPKIGVAETWNARIAAVRSGGMKSIAGGVIERWFTPDFRAAHPSETSAALAMLESCNPEGYVSACAAVRDADFRHLIGRIALPTLAVTGTHDPVTPPSDARFIQQAIPGAEYLELAAAHISNVEARGHFNREVLAFLLK